MLYQMLVYSESMCHCHSVIIRHISCNKCLAHAYAMGIPLCLLLPASQPLAPHLSHLCASSPSFHTCSSYPTATFTFFTKSASPVFLPMLSLSFTACLPFAS